MDCAIALCDHRMNSRGLLARKEVACTRETDSLITGAYQGKIQGSFRRAWRGEEVVMAIPAVIILLVGVCLSQADCRNSEDVNR
jgi:hypothetical protein